VGEQHRVGVVEHLFSALYGLKQFNVRLDVYGEEIPFFDGSCMDFVKAVKGLNQDQSSGIRLDNRISVHENGGSILYTPLAADELFVHMSLAHPYIGVQSMVLEIKPSSYEAQIAPARTFVFTDESDARLADIPPYGIGITREKIYAKTPLRFPDEPVRHKILDLLGDLYVLKRPIYGKITGNNTSHQLNLQFVRKLHSILGDDNE
jgi:UDP-3-O-[3-hydroxymyristoyl] N-acetylglucosamine deacetylase